MTKNKDGKTVPLLKINRSFVIFVWTQKGFLSRTILAHLPALFYKLFSALKAKYVARLSGPAFGAPTLKGVPFCCTIQMELECH